MKENNQIINDNLTTRDIEEYYISLIRDKKKYIKASTTVSWCAIYSYMDVLFGAIDYLCSQHDGNDKVKDVVYNSNRLILSYVMYYNFVSINDFEGNVFRDELVKDIKTNMSLFKTVVYGLNIDVLSLICDEILEECENFISDSSKRKEDNQG